MSDDKQNISDLFTLLKTAGINVISMKNKTNRLEQLFIAMLNGNSTNGESINGENK